MDTMKCFSEVIATLPVSANNSEFIVADHFIINTNKEAKVRISSLGENFLDCFIGVREGPFPGSILQSRRLLEDFCDTEIFDELEEKAVVTLREIYAVIETGETDLFVGYARDIYNEICAVMISLTDDGYEIESYPTEYPSELYEGNIIYFRQPAP